MKKLLALAVVILLVCAPYFCLAGGKANHNAQVSPKSCCSSDSSSKGYSAGDRSTQSGRTSDNNQAGHKSQWSDKFADQGHKTHWGDKSADKDRKDHWADKSDRFGDRDKKDRQWDLFGDRLEQRGERLEQKGERLERLGERLLMNGFTRLGERLERQGAYLERLGERLDQQLAQPGAGSDQTGPKQGKNNTTQGGDKASLSGTSVDKSGQKSDNKTNTNSLTAGQTGQTGQTGNKSGSVGQGTQVKTQQSTAAWQSGTKGQELDRLSSWTAQTTD